MLMTVLWYLLPFTQLLTTLVILMQVVINRRQNEINRIQGERLEGLEKAMEALVNALTRKQP